MAPSPLAPLNFAATQAWVAKVLIQAGVIAPHRPDRVARLGMTLLRWGVTPAAGYASAAVLHPDEPAIIDELGALTFAAVHDRSTRLAHALRDEGVRAADNVGILCRNHRGFVEASVALAKLGAHALYLNTSFAG